MLISNATTRALNDIQTRERDVLEAYVSGALPSSGDVAEVPGYAYTTDALFAAPPQDAYFVTEDERGRRIFTRDGSFALKDGVLVDEQGRPIQGYRDDGAALAPLQADPVDVALGFTEGARIEADGAVTYERTVVDPKTGRRQAQQVSLGRVALARFAPGSKLQSVDPQHVCASPGVAPHLGRAGDGNFGAIVPHARAGSGVDLDVGLQRLEEAYLALDAIRAAAKAHGTIEKTAMDLLK